MRIEHRWAALQEANKEKENAKLEKRAYQSVTFENVDTRSELLVRSRYLLFKSSEKWTDEQKLYYLENILTSRRLTAYHIR